MSWIQQKSMAWNDPLTVAARHAGGDCALLYSGRQEAYSGRYSYLFLSPIEVISGSDWAAIPPIDGEPNALPVWVGYLGYGMRAQLPRGIAAPIHMPDFRLVRYGRMLRFDHGERRIDVFFDATHTSYTEPQAISSKRAAAFALASLTSNFTRASYEAAVAETIARIEAGDFYQANITRKFHGSFTTTPDSWAVFNALCVASPAPYSAFIRHQGSCILSSSPECFLSVDAEGRILTRPIKGSARRGTNDREDDEIRDALQSSPKNLAENLMITDLMRHDLAQVSVAGSVEVLEQSALSTYATIHHLISSIQAQRRTDMTAVDIANACFPPGSMTGAPKIAAINWCQQLEGMERGIYSGAIGWFGGQNSCDLSVVIRTLILQGNQFEFQVGGGIVADSNSEDEWRETLIKARGIATALGIQENELAAI